MQLVVWKISPRCPRPRHVVSSRCPGPCVSPPGTPRSSSGRRCSPTGASGSEAASSWSRGYARSRSPWSTAGRSTRCYIREGQPLSGWAREPARPAGATPVAMAAELLHELGGKAEERPSCSPSSGCRRTAGAHPRPARACWWWSSTGRPRPATSARWCARRTRSAPSGVIVTGHAADPYDPKAVRASTGSLLALPVVRAASHHEVRRVGDGTAAAPAPGGDRRHRRGWRGRRRRARPDRPDRGGGRQRDPGPQRRVAAGVRPMVRIPITGAASSLNAATAASVVLYEATRQRVRALINPRSLKPAPPPRLRPQDRLCSAPRRLSLPPSMIDSRSLKSVPRTRSRGRFH